jgi:hypothetical protein
MADELRDRVAQVLDEHLRGAWRSGTVTDRVLAALGLDDLDATAVRSIDAWAHDYANDDWRDLSAEGQLAVARRVLEVALTPPGGDTA